MDLGWVSLPTSEFEQLHAEIRAWREVAEEGRAEIERLKAKIEEIEKQRLNWAQPLRDRHDALLRENERLRAVIDRLSRALSHS